MSGFFHAEFHGVYRRHFEAAHPFWESFDSLWFAAANAVCREAAAADMDLGGFREIAARKLCPANIPLVAMHHHCAMRTDIGAWLQFTGRLAEWWQLFDDLMDWHEDCLHGVCSYFLCEGSRRKRQRESLHQWVAREGFQWGVATLEDWWRDLRAASLRLGSRDVEAFLDDRAAMFREIVAQLRPGFDALTRLADVLDFETQTGRADQRHGDPGVLCNDHVQIPRGR
jgi:hypothetical protein